MADSPNQSFADKVSHYSVKPDAFLELDSAPIRVSIEAEVHADPNEPMDTNPKGTSMWDLKPYMSTSKALLNRAPDYRDPKHRETKFGPKYVPVGYPSQEPALLGYMSGFTLNSSANLYETPNPTENMTWTDNTHKYDLKVYQKFFHQVSDYGFVAVHSCMGMLLTLASPLGTVVIVKAGSRAAGDMKLPQSISALSAKSTHNQSGNGTA